MSAPPLSSLKDVQVGVDAEQISMSWAHRGNHAPIVRVLRSDQWFPQLPDDDQGLYGAVRVSEGSAHAVMDSWHGGDREAYYSLFALQDKGAWCQTVQVRILRPDAQQAGATHLGGLATVVGDRRSAPPGTLGRETLLVVLPGAFVASMISTSLVSALTFAVIAFWRQIEGADAGYLWSADPNVTFFGTADIVWFVLRTLAAMGVWVVAAFAFSPRMLEDRRLQLLLLAAPALLAVAFPQGAIAAGAALAVALAALDWRDERAG